MKKKLVVLSGAGMSAESGVKTFRDSNGLWENHSIEDVATPMAWQKNPQLVLNFYNQRRTQLLQVHPNKGHELLAKIQTDFETHIITQNVDDLHERAGSKNVLHLHGELLKVRSTKEPSLIYSWKKDLQWGDCCDLKSQLRPHIVWFGEQVPAMDEAIKLCRKADIFLVVGTSLQVYPAASLTQEIPFSIPKYLIDPKPPETHSVLNFEYIQEGAVNGISIFIQKIMPYAH